MTTFFFAGEPSGDLLGASLVTKDAVGVGGPAMQEKGLKPLFDFDAFQVMGFTSVLPALPRILFLGHQIKKWILKNNPRMVVLIDYAEFNLFMAKQLRKGGYKGKIVHYVCPSIWAWRKKRGKVLEENVDHLLSILPFEEKLFQKLPVSYVGHPLAKAIETHTYTKSYPGIALFPGSRKQEIKQNLPLQLKAAQNMGPIYISLASEKLRPLIEKIAPKATVVPPCYRYDLMKTAKGAIATSGTVILELGLHATPTVVTYPLSAINYFLAKQIFKIRLPYYTLVNLIADKELYPEFIHRKVDPAEVQQALKKVMEKKPHFEMPKKEAANPKEILELLHSGNFGITSSVFAQCESS